MAGNVDSLNGVILDSFRRMYRYEPSDFLSEQVSSFGTVKSGCAPVNGIRRHGH